MLRERKHKEETLKRETPWFSSIKGNAQGM